MHVSIKPYAGRYWRLLTASLLTSVAGPALAQSVVTPAQPLEAAPTDSGTDVENPADIVVTGSRISNGNNKPTPVTVLDTDALLATTPASIPDGLNKLPAFNSTSTPNNATFSNGRGFGAVGNFLNLRTLGAIRTLILQDGNRVPGTFYDTTVDTNMLPQLLIQRVEIVTGGASAVYGSDAVTGVVNFITDNKFNGVRAIMQGGVSKYRDAESFRGGIAYGGNLSDRAHIIASVEYYSRAGVGDAADRPYGDLAAVVIGNGTAARPYQLRFGARQSNTAPGGLVTNGPFANQQFLNDGTLAPFNPGTPTGNANVAIGGDGGRVKNLSVLPDFESGQAFGRIDYEFSDSLNGYVSARYAINRAESQSQIYTNTPNAYPITIYTGNAFLPSALQAQLTATNTTSFNMNRFNNDLFGRLVLISDTEAGAVNVGLNGKLFGDFTWDAFYTHGTSRNRLLTQNNAETAKFYAALDAVRDPQGNIVCRSSLVTPSAFPGCVPINLFGQGNASEAAIDYVLNDTYWTARNNLDDFNANVTGTLFEGWAGPIKAAVGAEFRHASLKVDTTTPDNSFDPSNLRLGPAGNSLPGSYPSANLRWFKEVQSPATGEEDVYEANVELAAPLLRDLPLIDLLSFNGAYRHTQYRTRGNQNVRANFSANTWKLGLEWKVYDDLRLRGTISRDIRAPTLWDLYQQQNITAAGINDPLTGVTGQLNTIAGGNPELLPEIAKNLTAGAVLSPSWLTGFSMSFDYYHIRIDNALGFVNGTNPVVQAQCLASDGSSPFCALLTRPISYNSTAPGNFPILNRSLAQNIARIRLKGFDVEANYRIDLNDWGKLDLRALWTHQATLTTETIPGALVTDQAGTQTAPTDKATVSLNYAMGGFSFDLLERYVSPIRQSENPTLVFDIPNVSAYYQTDINLAYDFGKNDHSIVTFLSVSNLFNAKGDIYQNTTSGGSIGLRYPSVSYADLVGRYFTAGVRLSM